MSSARYSNASRIDAGSFQVSVSPVTANCKVPIERLIELWSTKTLKTTTFTKCWQLLFIYKIALLFGGFAVSTFQYYLTYNLKLLRLKKNGFFLRFEIFEILARMVPLEHAFLWNWNQPGLFLVFDTSQQGQNAPSVLEKPCQTSFWCYIFNILKQIIFYCQLCYTCITGNMYVDNFLLFFI